MSKKRLTRWLRTPLEPPFHLLGLQKVNPVFDDHQGFTLDNGWLYHQDGWYYHHVEPGPLLSITIYGVPYSFHANETQPYLDIWYEDRFTVGVLWAYLP